ncbi:MAG: PTS sugar transporter subunit IIC [Gemmatimonadetes bacterium]|nr:PTS sugar transporter subunit IIC [Gemmatimonadota bacterium]
MELLQLTLLGGVLALDATSVGQFMISRPLVAGALTGWVIGAPEAGVAVGAILELYLLVSYPTGGSRFPEGATASVVAAAAAHEGSGGALALAVAVGLVWGQLAGSTVTWLRRVNARLLPDPEKGPATAARVVAAHLAAVLLDFARGAAVTIVGVLVARPLVARLASTWPIAADATLGLLLMGGGVSVGILLRDLGGFRRRVAAFVAGFVLVGLGVGLL